MNTAEWWRTSLQLSQNLRRGESATPHTVKKMQMEPGKTWMGTWTVTEIKATQIRMTMMKTSWAMKRTLRLREETIRKVTLTVKKDREVRKVAAET